MHAERSAAHRNRFRDVEEPFSPEPRSPPSPPFLPSALRKKSGDLGGTRRDGSDGMPDDDRENRLGSRRQGPGRTVAIAGRELGRPDGSSGLSQSQPDDGSARNAALIKALSITGRGTLSPRSGRGTAKQGERETGRRRSPIRPTPGRADITGGPKKAARPGGGVGRIPGRRGRRTGAEQNRIRRAGEPRNGGAGDAGWGSVSSRALKDGRGASALVPFAFKPRRT